MGVYTVYGTYYFTLSLPPDASPKNNYSIILPTVCKLESSYYNGLTYIDSSRDPIKIIPFVNDVNGSTPINGALGAWHAGDTLVISGSYEIT
jgi:hypothetical protein